MMIVLQMWQMLGEESSVHFMILNMGLNAVFGNATIKKFLELKLARSISNTGLGLSNYDYIIFFGILYCNHIY